MSEHLPECDATDCGCTPEEECGPNCINLCICDRLRACEQRVTERHNAEHEDDRLAAFQNGYDAATVKERQRSVLLIADAYGKGLSAARDAVDALFKPGWPPTNAEILAAIDAIQSTQNAASGE